MYVGVKSNCEELNNEELHWQVNANPIISECILYGPSVKIVKLYNLLGACVKSWNFNDETFPCLSFSGVTPGIYVLHMHGKAISGTLKVVVK